MPCSAAFNQFPPVTLSFLEKVVTQIKPFGCPSDVLPPRLFKEVFHRILNLVLNIFNCSLSSGVVPANFKLAVVQPYFQAASLIQNLETKKDIDIKIVFSQLKSFIDEHGMDLKCFKAKNLHY